MEGKINIPRGTYDILPQQSYKWHWLKDQFHLLANKYGFQEIVTPIFEAYQLFERGVGKDTDIIEKEMYRFVDRKGRSLALRPEGTASVVRSYIENHMHKDGNLTKLYYLGPMFRYDRPQKGRYRQFYQYGIELLGSKSPYYDAEVISFADHFLRNLGLKKYRLELNSIGCADCSPNYDKALIEYYQGYKPQLCNDCLKRIDSNPKRLLDCKVENCKTISHKAPSMIDYLDDDCRQDFESVCKFLDQMNVSYTVNPRIVRGLDYYNKTAFEFINTGLKTQNALLGGGRYDTLVSMLGGPDTPAIGLAGGFERLIDAMEAENLFMGSYPKPTLYFITVGEEAKNSCAKICSLFRKNDINVEFDFERNSSIKAQLKSAVKANADYALIMGEDEAHQNTINLKNLNTSEQRVISLTEIPENITELLF